MRALVNLKMEFPGTHCEYKDLCSSLPSLYACQCRPFFPSKQLLTNCLKACFERLRIHSFLLQRHPRSKSSLPHHPGLPLGIRPLRTISFIRSGHSPSSSQVCYTHQFAVTDIFFSHHNIGTTRKSIDFIHNLKPTKTKR